MESFPWAGVIVVTYGAIFTAALGGVIALFRRMGKVEEAARRAEDHGARLDKVIDEIREDVKRQGAELTRAMTDLRVHMAEEGRNVDRLEKLIVQALDRREVA